MLTRQGRRSPDEEKRHIVKALEDAGIPDASLMPENERLTLYKALEESKVEHVEEETQRLSLNSQCPPLHDSPESHMNQSLLKTPTSSLIPPKSPNKEDLFNSIAESSLPQTPPGLENQTQISKPRPVPKDVEEMGARPRKLSLGKNLSVKSAARGRGVPVTTKYPPLPISNPGQKPNTALSPAGNNYQNSSQNYPSSPICVQSLASPIDSPSSSQDRPSSPENQEKARKSLGQIPSNDSSPQNATLSQSSSTTLSPIKPALHEVSSEALDDSYVNVETVDEDVCVDVETASQEAATSQSISSVYDNQSDSPASVEDAGVEEEEKEPVKTVKVGKFLSQVSPLEAEIKSEQHFYLPIFFQELEKFRGNKVEWMEKAKASAQEQRQALWQELMLKNPAWSSPIGDGGYNKRTLFKQIAPSYSKLFSSTPAPDKPAGTGTVRTEWQANSPAMTKTNQDEWFDPDFKGLRKSRQKDFRTQQQPEDGEQDNAWTSKKKNAGLEGDEDFSEDVIPSGRSERWRSKRLEQARNQADSDSEVSPGSPSVVGPHDVYEFENDIWEPAKNKSKKNFKRGAKSVQDVDVESKAPHRGRGAAASQQNQRGRSTRSRVQRGAISRPSEHASNSKNKVVFSDPTEGETNARNNANTERSWHGTDQSGIEGSDIEPKTFSSLKGVHPRRPKENRRPNDFPSSPGSSGNYQQHEARNEAAAVETQECPICGKEFPTCEIEAHCSGCVDFKTDGVGDKPSIEIEDSEESDKTVEEDLERGKCEAKETAVLIKCSRCEQHLTRNEVTLHKNCTENVSSASASLKRGSVVEFDDGPVKKATRFID